MPRTPRFIFKMLAIAAASSGLQAQARIESPAEAIEVAKRYTKGRCTSQSPCTYKPQREGNQWRVWVHRTKREPRPTLVLYFDLNGNLIRRVESE